MAKRSTIPGTKLRFMKDQEFDDEAALLLAEFGNSHGQVIAPPIPIDEIVELYLKLRLEFNDMRQLFGVDDVHGALWANKKLIGIDQRLDPTENPAMLGRYNFTLAHEGGHWRLHRHLFQRKANQLKLLADDAERPEYICRSNDKDPIEYQANRFASCLLMPREMVKRAWHAWRGSMEPIYLSDLRATHQQILSAASLCRGAAQSGTNGTDEMLLEHASRPLAELFQVSAEAMRIRLQSMKLLLAQKETSLFD
jgi:hypothetical protein